MAKREDIQSVQSSVDSIKTKVEELNSLLKGVSKEVMLGLKITGSSTEGNLKVEITHAKFYRNMLEKDDAGK